MQETHRKATGLSCVRILLESAKKVTHEVYDNRNDVSKGDEPTQREASLQPRSFSNIVSPKLRRLLACTEKTYDSDEQQRMPHVRGVIILWNRTCGIPQG